MVWSSEHVQYNNHDMLLKEKSLLDFFFHCDLLLSFLHYKHRKGLTFPLSYNFLSNCPPLSNPAICALQLFHPTITTTPPSHHACIQSPSPFLISLKLNNSSRILRLFTPQFRDVIVHGIDYHKQ